MTRTGTVSLLAALLLIACTLFIPYIRYKLPPNGQENEFQKLSDEDDQLADAYRSAGEKEPVLILIMLPLFYPLILLLESTFWTDRKKVWKRLLLVVQGLAMIIGSYLICFIMSFRIFCPPYEYLFMYYIIPVYLLIGIVWNLLLAIPGLDGSKVISRSFERLSLKKRN
jgi:hypothetical protein